MVNNLPNTLDLMNYVGTLTLRDVLPYMVMILVTLVFVVILVLFLMPRLLFTLNVKYRIFASQFTQKYLKLDNITWCSCLERGNIDSTIASVLCLHGMSSSADYFVQIDSMVNPAYHLVAIDYLNHGNSTKLNRVVEMDDIIRFVKKFVEKSGLYRRKFHLVGVSFGGCIATTYTAAYPDDVASLTLFCPFISSGEDFVNVPILNFSLNTNEELERYLQIMSSGKMEPLPSILLTAYRHHINWREESHSYVRDGTLKSPVKCQLQPDLLKKVKQNVLVIWGADDKVLYPEGADYLKEHLHSAMVKYVREAGHMLLVTHMKEVMNITVDFLADQKVEKLTPLSN